MKQKQPAIRIYVRPLIKGAEQHGFVWRLQRGRVEILRDIAANESVARMAAEACLNRILSEQTGAGQQ